MRSIRVLTGALAAGATLVLLGGTAYAATDGVTLPAAHGAPAANCPAPSGLYPPARTCALALSASVAGVGDTITYTSTPSCPTGSFTTRLYGLPDNVGVSIGGGTVSSTGVAVGTFVVPAGTPNGPNTVEVFCGTERVRADFRVLPTTVLGEIFTKTTSGTTNGLKTSVLGEVFTKPAGSLPFTGADILPLIAVGGAAVVGGGALVLAGRRRKGSQPVA